MNIHTNAFLKNQINQIAQSKDKTLLYDTKAYVGLHCSVPFQLTMKNATEIWVKLLILIPSRI